MSKYIVPVEDRQEYYNLVQRANRRIKANQKYLIEHQIQSFKTQRALMGQFNDPEKWKTRTAPLSRSVKFESREDYEDYIEYINKWGTEGKNYEKSVDVVKDSYKQAIIEALNRTLINKNIPTENGQIPAEILEKIDKMTVEQLAHFFGGEADEELENQSFDSDNIREGDIDSFEKYVNSQLGWTRRAYPEKEKISIKKPKKKSTKGKVKKPKKAKANIRKTKYKKKL